MKGMPALFLVFLLAGCAVGPDYKRPEIDSPGQFRGGLPMAGTNSPADLPWWDVYRDEQLRRLIAEALRNNHDLRVAISRVEQAREVARQSRALFFPGVELQGGASRGRNAAFNTAISSGGTVTENFFAVANAAWEIDVWGRIRRLNESALAQFLATDAARVGIHTSLVAGVAQAWFELLELDLELSIARRTTNSFGESYRIFAQRLEGGVVSKLETSRAEAALATTAAQVPDLKRQIALKENELCILLGRKPGPIERSRDLLQQTLPDIPAGLPSALLERRPDIRQAEETVRAANARIGVAMAEFFPRIGLTAFGGKVSSELSAFTSGAANAWSLAASVTGPIFEGGAVRSQHRQAIEVWRETVVRYEQTALNALREVSDALISRDFLRESRDELVRAVAAYNTAVEVSMERYMAGRASYYEVLEAQQQLFPAENALARTRLGELLVVVQLYKALGGGWQHASRE